MVGTKAIQTGVTKIAGSIKGEGVFAALTNGSALDIEIPN